MRKRWWTEILGIFIYVVFFATLVPWVHKIYVEPIWMAIIATVSWLLGWQFGRLLPSRGNDNLGTKKWISSYITSLKWWPLVVFAVIFFVVQFVWRPPIWTYVTVALKWKHQAQFAGLYVAAQRGYFAGKNIRVELLEGGPDPEQDPFVLVENDTAQFGIGDPITLIEERSAAKPFTTIAVIFQKSPVCWFLRKGNRSFTPRDLIGKTVAVSSGRTNVDKELELWIYKQKLENYVVRKDVTEFLRLEEKERELFADVILEVPLRRTGLDTLGHFLSGNIDVWSGYTSNELQAAERLLGRGKLEILQSDPHIYGDLLFTSDTILTTKRAMVKHFLEAFLRGWLYAIDPQLETSVLKHIMHYVADKGQESRFHQLEMLRSLREHNVAADDETQPFGLMNEPTWSALVKDLQQTGVISSTIDVSALFDSTIVEEITLAKK